jgi:hypothetical protein
MSYKNVQNATSYQFLIMPYYINESSDNPFAPSPFTYRLSSQTTDTVTFSNMTAYKYRCYVQATNSKWSTELLSKEISMPLIINNPIIAVANTANNQVNLYFKKDSNTVYSIGSVNSTPTFPSNSFVSLDNKVIDNGIILNTSALTGVYRFSLNGVAGSSNLIFMGQGSLASATVAPVVTKTNDTSFTASIPTITGVTSYQFIVYDMNLEFLYSAVNQTSNSFTCSNVPFGTYVVTIQASNSTGTKVGVSSPIVI